MSDIGLQDQITAAEAYEALHVPALFRQWPPRILNAVPLESGNNVLDVACGTGVLAREAAKRVGAEGSVAGIDPGQGMLALARRLAPDIDWQEGVAESLPYADQTFDAVVSQFGLMFFSNRSKALHEMYRVLAPGGHIAIAVWDSLDNSDAYPEEVELLERLAGRAAADALRAPFVLGDEAVLTEMFDSAGLESVSITTHHGTGQFPSIRDMVEADLRGWLPVMGVMLDEESIAAILKEAEVALQAYVAADGTVKFDSPANIITGIRP